MFQVGLANALRSRYIGDSSENGNTAIRLGKPSRGRHRKGRTGVSPAEATRPRGHSRRRVAIRSYRECPLSARWRPPPLLLRKKAAHVAAFVPLRAEFPARKSLDRQGRTFSPGTRYSQFPRSARGPTANHPATWREVSVPYRPDAFPVLALPDASIAGSFSAGQAIVLTRWSKETRDFALSATNFPFFAGARGPCLPPHDTVPSPRSLRGSPTAAISGFPRRTARSVNFTGSMSSPTKSCALGSPRIFTRRCARRSRRALRSIRASPTSSPPR